MQTYDPHKSTTEVRQASGRKMNLRVLINSIVGIIIVLTVLYAIYALTQSAPA